MKESNREALQVSRSIRFHSYKPRTSWWKGLVTQKPNTQLAVTMSPMG